MSSFQQQLITRHRKQQKNAPFEETQQAWEPDLDMAQILKVEDVEFKITTINMLRAPVDTEDKHERIDR